MLLVEIATIFSSMPYIRRRPYGARLLYIASTCYSQSLHHCCRLVCCLDINLIPLLLLQLLSLQGQDIDIPYRQEYIYHIVPAVLQGKKIDFSGGGLDSSLVDFTPVGLESIRTSTLSPILDSTALATSPCIVFTSRALHSSSVTALTVLVLMGFADSLRIQ